MLRIHLLGAPSIVRNGKPLSLTPQLLTLFAYLLLFHHRDHSRSFLAGLFWPDVPEDKARRSLSNALYRLRQMLGDHDPLHASRESIGVHSTPGLWVDVEAFRRSLAEGDLSRALELYRGDLLQGYYDDWLLMPRLELRIQAVQAMEQLAAAYAAEGQFAAALGVARRLTLVEPLNENGHQLIIRMLVRLQRHNEALAHYDDLVALLDDEMGIEPGPKTQALVAKIHSELSLANPTLLQQEHTPRPGEPKAVLPPLAEVQHAFERLLESLSSIPARERVQTLLVYARVCEITEDTARQGEVLLAALREARALDDEALLAEALALARDYNGGQSKCGAAGGTVGPSASTVAGPCRVTVTLARHDAPLGRPLAKDEKVTLRWTLEAPEDAVISDKIQRRHHVLRRLLDEAAAAGAAPTDDDLAAALGVSRHTILRDMAVLAQEGHLLPTRRRR